MLFYEKTMFINVRLTLFETLKFPAMIPYPLLIISGFVVATGEPFREGTLKMDTALPGRGDAYRQRSQELWQSTWEVQSNFWFLLLVKIPTELQLAFVMEMVLLWMTAKAVQKHFIQRRYFFG